MDEIIRVQEQYYILATSSRVDDRTRILKHDDTFAVFDRAGNILPVGMGEHGIYHECTRHLSRLELLFANRRPILLGSTVKEDNPVLSVDLTNPDIQHQGQIILPRDTLHIFRYAFLWKRIFYSRLRIRNFSLMPVEVHLTLRFEADFADIFEVRGVRRERRGKHLEPVSDERQVQLSYEGLDGAVRRTILEFSSPPSELLPSSARLTETLGPQEDKSHYLTIRCESGPPVTRHLLSFHNALEHYANEFRESSEDDARVRTSNDQFNHWLNRSAADLHIMVSQTAHGPYPYAGVPWFSTVFGRDGIIAALEYLPFNPLMARGVLAYLAANQATQEDPEQDAEPGKVLHEMRTGEMASLHEIPFGRYYGSIDATPLFIVLAGAYHQRTGDWPFLESIWPHVERALSWIDEYGDADGDGFVEFVCRSSRGLVNQGWKDSVDSVFHADGTLAEVPIALCEVQGYVYAARRAAANLAQGLGRAPLAARLQEDARNLRDAFDEAFWHEDLGTYAAALDRAKRPCLVRTSNAGHALWTGIAKPQRMERLARTLLDEASFSGWGVRTVANTEFRYNPMAYHNGSIWPHDNALIASGLARHGFKTEALKILEGLFEASKFVELNRMPELLCGFVRRPGEGPTMYPVACAPQAWAAGAVFMLLQACLGISFDAPRSQIRVDSPVLPEFLDWVTIRKLRLLEATVDLSFRRDGQDVVLGVPRKQGRVEIMVVK